MKYIILALSFLLTPVIAFAGSPATSDTGYAYCNGGERAAVKYAVIDKSTSGDNTIVAAVTGKKIRVLSYIMTAQADTAVRWESGASGTALSGQMYFGPGETNQVLSINCAPYGCFQTAAGSLLNLEMSGANQIDGHLTYVECS